MRKAIVIVFIIFFALLFFLLRDNPDNVHGDVIVRQPAFVNGHQALVTRDSAGATTSFVYRVYINSKEGNDEILRMSNVDGINLHWTSPDTLVVKIECGEILKFSNVSYILDNQGQLINRIEIKLISNGLCATP